MSRSKASPPWQGQEVSQLRQLHGGEAALKIRARFRTSAMIGRSWPATGAEATVASDRLLKRNRQSLLEEIAVPLGEEPEGSAA